MVTVPDIAKVERAPSNQWYSTFILVACMRRISIIPDVNGDLIVQFLPLDYVGHGYSFREFKVTLEHDILSNVSRNSVSRIGSKIRVVVAGRGRHDYDITHGDEQHDDALEHKTWRLTTHKWHEEQGLEYTRMTRVRYCVFFTKVCPVIFTPFITMAILDDLLTKKITTWGIFLITSYW